MNSRFEAQHANGVNSISLPTNGFVVERSITVLEGLAGIEGLEHINFALSIDGLEAVHDRIRGCAGAFERAWKVLLAAVRIARNHGGRISVSINTVIGLQPLEDALKLAQRVKEEMPQVKQTFELFRDPAGSRKMTFTHDALEAFQVQMLREARGDLSLFSSDYLEWVRLSRRYQIQRKNRFGDEPWSNIPCSAGRYILVMDADGGVRLCELKDPIGNVRDHSYDIPKIMNTREARASLQRIRQDRCACSHVCFLYESMLDSPRFMFIDLPCSALALQGDKKRAQQ